MTGATGKDVLRKVADWLVKLLAGLLTLSWAGLILFPLTIAGAITSVVSLAAIALLYRRSPTPKAAIASLAICGLAIIAANSLSIRWFTGPVYMFRCTSVSLSCARVQHITAFGRSILIVPAWDLKFRTLSYLMGGRTETFEPRAVNANGLTILHAPFEEQAILEQAPVGAQGEYDLQFPINLPHAVLSIKREDQGKVRIGYDVEHGLVDGIRLRSNLSDAAPGQFSIVTPLSADGAAWRRLVFSNELIRSFIVKDASEVLSEVEKEAERTDLFEDFVRSEVIRVTFDGGYYAGLRGVTQRLFNIREARQRMTKSGAFEVSPNAPWNRAFVISALGALVQMGTFYDGVAREERHQLSDGRIASRRVSYLPWKGDAEWLLEKGAPALAGTGVSGRYARALSEILLTGNGQTAGDILSQFDQIDPPDELRQQAAGILTRADRPFQQLFRDWVSGLNSQQKARRVAIMRGEIERATFRAVQVALVDGLTGIGEAGELERNQRTTLYLRVKAATEFVQANVARGAALKEFAVTDLQRLEIEDDRAGWEPMLSFAEKAVLCDEERGECDRVLTDIASKWFASPKRSPRTFEIFLRTATIPDGDPAILSTALAKTLAPIGAVQSFAEVDQGVAPVLFAMLRVDRTLNAIQEAKICSAADRYSRELIAVPDTERRIFQHEGAILLSYLCRRNWGSKHSLVLARADLDPGVWLSILIDKLRRTSPS